MAEGGIEAVRADDEVVARSEVRELEKRIRELERVLGKKTLENEILRWPLQLSLHRFVVFRRLGLSFLYEVL